MDTNWEHNTSVELKDKLAQENVYFEFEIRSELYFEEIVGNSEPLRSAAGVLKKLLDSAVEITLGFLARNR